jgi:hypothetical protein
MVITCSSFPTGTEGGADGSLQYVGKSALEPTEGVLSVGNERLDLEMLIGMPLDKGLQSSGLLLDMTHLSEYEESVFGPGDYVRLVQHLYKVNEHGIFEHLGKHEGNTTHELLTAFELLTGKLVGAVRFTESPRARIRRKPEEKDHVTLPDENADVQIIGYTHGMDMPFIMSYGHLSPDQSLTKTWPTILPTELCDIEEMAREGASHLISENGYCTTNFPDLFCEQYTKGFVEGYQFGLHAKSHGLMELLHSMRTESDALRYELSRRFAHELILKEPTPNKDDLMSSKLDQLKAMYEEYQSAS